MPRRFYDCHAKERGDLCGSPDCRTCHPENFKDCVYLWTTCESCGSAFKKDEPDDEEVCDDCVRRAQDVADGIELCAASPQLVRPTEETHALKEPDNQ